MSDRGRATLLLFSAAVLFVPVPFFMFVIGGLVPLAWIGFLTLQGVFVGLPKLTSEAFFMLGILLVHVAIIGGVLYLASFIVSWVLFRLLAPRPAYLIVVLLICGLAVASLFEIYRAPGHNSAPPANIVRLIRGLAV